MNAAVAKTLRSAELSKKLLCVSVASAFSSAYTSFALIRVVYSGF